MNIRELLEKRAKLVADARALLKKGEDEKRDLKTEEKAEWERIMAEVKALGEQIERAQQMTGIEAELGRSLGEPIKPEPIQKATAAKGPFRSMGEQLMAVRNLATGKSQDQRLFEVRALGVNEEIGSEGGFLLQPAFSQELFARAYEVGAFASRCRRFPVPAGSNTLTINAVDEISRVTGSRFGGVQSYWLAAGATITPTKPKFRQIDLRLKKLASVYYATDEELSDVNTLEATIGEFMTADMAFMLDEGIWGGSGVGQPLGVMNSAALVTVAKEAGQAAATVVAENITKMWSRCWARSRPNAVWFINQDVEPQLDLMGLTVGLGGVPVYLPPGGFADAPYGRLKGRPVVVVENCSTLGTAGDIVLADLSQYFLADKGGIEAASSIHVAFLTDESAFRFIYRVDGQPAWSAVLTPAKGSNTLSPFVALATRA